MYVLQKHLSEELGNQCHLVKSLELQLQESNGKWIAVEWCRSM